MSETNEAAKPEEAGKRRPVAEDLPAIMEMISGGKSLRAACRELGLHNPSTDAFIRANPDYREQYAHAREGRAEFLQEDGLTITKAAALGQTVGGHKIDPAGARVYLDALKWAAARMAPKTAPVQRVAHTFSHLSDEELAAEIATLSGDADDAPADED
jgi:hypothetical protein